MLHKQTTADSACAVPPSRPAGLCQWLHSPAADVLQLVLLAAVLLLEVL